MLSTVLERVTKVVVDRLGVDESEVKLKLLSKTISAQTHWMSLSLLWN